jgi:alkylhydroperoxidase/carboxymuconolactone decarboxylase family protein YurZ
MNEPTIYEWMRTRYPELITAYDAVGDAAYQAGPLSERERHLVKLALALGAGLEGAAHSHTRRALEAGIDGADIRHVALLSITTPGFPSMVRGMSWLEDVLES